MFCEPLAGWRDVSVRPRRTKVDWAIEMRRILNEQYMDAEKVTLVCDNLNTHVTASIHEAFRKRRKSQRSQLDRSRGLLACIAVLTCFPRFSSHLG